MASDNALTLVNRVLIMTGDYEPVTTVVGSPANIAERIINFINIVINDLTRKIEFRELNTTYNIVANGLSSIQVIQQTAGIVVRPKSITSCIISPRPSLEEVSLDYLEEIKGTNRYPGMPRYFARGVGALGEAGVYIYPAPATGTNITLLSTIEPTKLSLSDISTTEILANDLLVLGAIAHSDAYSGTDRGYMQLYESAKNNEWKNTYEHQAFRVHPESYL